VGARRSNADELMSEIVALRLLEHLEGSFVMMKLPIGAVEFPHG
jgi:hypothetical protein